MVPPPTTPKQTLRQGFESKGNTNRSVGRKAGKAGRQAGNKGCVIKPVTTVGNWRSPVGGLQSRPTPGSWGICPPTPRVVVEGCPGCINWPGFLSLPIMCNRKRHSDEDLQGWSLEVGGWGWSGQPGASAGGTGPQVLKAQRHLQELDDFRAKLLFPLGWENQDLGGEVTGS